MRPYLILNRLGNFEIIRVRDNMAPILGIGAITCPICDIDYVMKDSLVDYKLLTQENIPEAFFKCGCQTEENKRGTPT